MKKPTLKISELKDQGLLTENSTNSDCNNCDRMLQLKFYFNNETLNQVNQMSTWPVKSEENAIRLLVDFENKGCYIKAAFLNPNNDNLSKTMGFKFDFKSHPYYKSLKQSSKNQIEPSL